MAEERQSGNCGNENPSGLAQRKPWLVAFTFGLLHGLGFAGGLSAAGCPLGTFRWLWPFLPQESKLDTSPSLQQPSCRLPQSESGLAPCLHSPGGFRLMQSEAWRL
jgi:hypothetical protein